MDQGDKRTLKNNYSYIVNNLDVESCMPDIIAADIFTDRQIEDIQCEKGNSRKADILIRHLYSRGPRAYEKFLSVLTPEFPFIVEKLERTGSELGSSSAANDTQSGGDYKSDDEQYIDHVDKSHSSHKETGRDDLCKCTCLLKKLYKHQHSTCRPFIWNRYLTCSISELYMELNLQDRTRNHVKLQNVFELTTTCRRSSVKRVLCEGHAGSGKSMMISMMIMDWVNEVEYMKQFSIVILVNEFNYDQTLSEIILLDDNNLYVKEIREDISLLMHLIHEFPNEVLFIIEGNEELLGEALNPKDPHSMSDIVKLVRMEGIFEQVTVFVTSRPLLSDDHIDEFDICLCNTGFYVEDTTQKCFKEFLKHFKKLARINETDDRFKNLYTQVARKDPVITDFVKIPLMCFLLCGSIDDSFIAATKPAGSKVGITQHQRTQQSTHEQNPSKTSLFARLVEWSLKQLQLPDKNMIAQIMTDISMIAKDTLENDVDEIRCDVLESSYPDTQKYLRNLCFLTHIKSGTMYDPCHAYKFAHDSIQEYLAAWYVGKQMNHNDRCRFLRQQLLTIDRDQFCIFTAGLAGTSTEDNTAYVLFNLLSNSFKDKESCPLDSMRLLLECTFECSKLDPVFYKSICNYIVKRIPKFITVNDEDSFRPSYFLALADLIKVSEVKSLEIDISKIEEELCVIGLSKSFSECVHLIDLCITWDHAHRLLMFLQTLPKENAHYKSLTIKCHTWGSEHRKLKRLPKEQCPKCKRIDCTCVKDVLYLSQQLGHALEKVSATKTTWQQCSNEHVISFAAEYLSGVTDCLYLYQCAVDEYFGIALKGNVSLVELNLTDCDLSSDACISLCESLHESKIVSLCLDRNKLTDSVLQSVGAFCRESETIEELSVSNNMIGDEGVEDFAKAFSGSTINRVYFSNNCIRGCEKVCPTMIEVIVSDRSHVEINLNGNPLDLLRGELRRQFQNVVC